MFLRNKIWFFYNKSYIKKSDIENLKCLFSFHELSLYILETKIGGHRANFLSGGPNSNATDFVHKSV